MNQNLTRVTYRGFRTGSGWEVAVARSGEPMRLLDQPRIEGEWALSILTNYLGDQARAADLHQDFASLTVSRLTDDWELSGSDIESALTEVEILRARWRIALMRG
jgi:predicted ATPase